jgi:uncharacterized membrane protein YcaP (DUF421 family)
MSLFMHVLSAIFGEGKDLTVIQMTARAVVFFIIAFGLIRLSGRRSFGLHTPLDNIISIALGAILSRAVVGASPFLPVVVSCTAIVLLHRGIGWAVSHRHWVSKFVEGEKIVLFEHGVFIDKNMGRALVSREDVMQGVRKSALTEDLSKIEKIYMEKNGEISAIKKQ